MTNEVYIYISELLYKNECVIIPRFGGIIARHISARISYDGGLVSPPSKSLLFNKNLQNNDGLLVNFIMEKQRITYDEASRICNDFANKCEHALQSKQRLEMPGIGVLFLDAEKNIQFEPQTDVNYLIDSFGLLPINAELLDLPTTEKIIDLKDRKPLVKPDTTRTKYLRIAAIAIGVPLLAVGVFASFNNSRLKNSFAAAFGFGKPAVYESKAYEDHNYKFSQPVAADVNTDANGYASFKLDPSSSAYIVVNVCDTVSADKTSVKKAVHHYSKNTTIANGKYKVVVGCFSVEDNAIRLVHTLKSRNINASLAGLNKNGLHVVSAGSSNDKNEARNLLEQTRQNYPSAWLMSE